MGHWASGVGVLWALVTWVVTSGQEPLNLLANPSFEGDLKDVWFSNGFTMERYAGDVYDGTVSAKCTGRDRDLEGPLQKNIAMHKGRHYAFEGYAKLLNENDKLWQNFKVIVQFEIAGEANFATYIIAYRGFVTMAKGWMRVNGSIEAPQKDVISGRLSFRGPDPGIDFLVDNLKLWELPEDPDWRRKADANIERTRKSDINFNVVVPASLANQKVELDIRLKKHQFGFGAKVEEYELGLSPKTLYERILNSWFNWATVQAYKWKFNKGDRYNPDFSRATDATEVLLANGKSVRGHSVFWDLKKNVPEWVIALDDSELRPEMAKHLNYMMNLTRGKLIQFDIQNEHVHGHYYEERLHDPSITKNAFRQAKAFDPNGPVLYLNDFTGVTSGANTEDLYDLAMEYKSEGVPIEGIGIQGHTKELVKPDPTAMWRRLDRLAQTGLDLTMTEFDIGWPDKEERADWLEDSIRAFFGHPNLKGVILWGFWNGSMREPDHELVLGPDPNTLTIVPSGERWACLTRREWTTREVKDMSETPQTFTIRGFRGDYEVIVKVNDKPVQRETFNVADGPEPVDFTVTESNAEIVVEEEEEFVPECVSHREETTVASASVDASFSDATLTCRTARAAASGNAEDDIAPVTCEPDEVMTACSSYQVMKQDSLKGETMELNADGVMQCTAYNGRSSTDVKGQGGIFRKAFNNPFAFLAKLFGRKFPTSRYFKTSVKPFARCCKVAGLKCNYKKAGPSLVFKGAMAEARCGEGEFAMGCSKYQKYPDSSGVKANDALTSCIAQSGKPAYTSPERSGAVSYAACCSATPTLECVTVDSPESGILPKKSTFVECPAGYTLTGCNVFAADGKHAGAKIVDTVDSVVCKAYMGAKLPDGSTGVKAQATCCRTIP